MKCSSVAVVLAVAMFVAAPCAAEDVEAGPPERGLRFHLSFDNRDVAAEYARGNPRSTTFTESLELRGVEGVSEYGFQIAADERLDYDPAGNFHLPRGTASLWIKPVNWKGRNDRFEVFLDVRSPGYLWRLYKYAQPNHLFCYLSAGKEKAIARTPAEDWKPGQWHHLAAAWTAEFIRLYVDGELAHEKKIEPAFDLSDVSEGTITVTPPKMWDKGFDTSDRTVVDELKIWDRVLEAAEIRRLYLTHAPKQTDAPPLDVRWEIDPDAGALLLEIDAFRLIDDGRELSVRAVLRDGQRRVRAKQTAQTRDGAAGMELAFGELEPGEYTVSVAALGPGGAEKAAVTETFRRPKVTWQDAPTFQHVVPEPWTPVEADGDAVRVWGREHTFDAGPLPRAVTSQNRDVLAAPARLTVNGREPAWRGAQVAAVHPDALVRKGSGAAGGIVLDWQTRLEFDGMIRCDVTLKPVEQEAEVRALELELPVAAAQGRHVLAPVLENWKDGRIALDWRDMVWLTGHRAGVCWFAESDANWVNAEGTKPITVERGEEVTTLRLTMIGEPVTIHGPVSYTFGLQATPLRALPEDWRNLKLGNANQVEGSRTMLVAQGGGPFKRNAYLVPRDDVDMDAVLERWTGWGAALPYSTPTFMADQTAIWSYYKRKWRNSERHAYVGYETHDGTGYSLHATCPRSDFSELMVHWVDDLLAGFPRIGGIYYDCCSATECRNIEHGCGGVDVFGRPYATRPIFDLRDVLRRVYTIAHQNGGIVMNHAHSRFYPPIHGFGDYWFPGEQYTTRLGEDLWYYTDRIPPEVWQIELSARVRGVGVQFLPEFGRGTDEKYRWEDPAPSRALVAACTLHDVPCSGYLIHPKVISELWTIYDRFRLSDAAFHGYWEPGCPVRVDAPLEASAYATESAVVVVVSNLTPEAAEGRLKINAAAIGIEAGWTLTRQPAGESIVAPFDAVPVSVPARDLLILAIAK